MNFVSRSRCFEHGQTVRRVDPFVDHWWETAWITPPWIARRIDRREDIELRDRLSLAAQVAPLLDDPRYLRFQARHGVALEETFAADRDALGTSRGSHNAFEGAVARRIVSYGWPEPRSGMTALAHFIRETPEACPGWRAGFDVWEEFRCDLNSKPRVNDIRDIAHVKVLPYVSHATLDRPWRSRCRQARDRLKKNNLWYAPFDRVYENVEQIIETWGV